MTKTTKKDSLAKFFYDYLPLIVFFACYKLADTANPLVTATIYMLITSFIALIVAYILTKKIAMMPLISAIILGIFGGLTILLKDEIFIKMKPTVINLLFAAVLFYGFFTKKAFLSYVIGEQIKISQEAWLILSARWAYFFVFLAALNEIIWRFFPTDFWVQFKVFGMMPISILFTISQTPFLMREIKKYNKTNTP